MFFDVNTSYAEITAPYRAEHHTVRVNGISRFFEGVYLNPRWKIPSTLVLQNPTVRSFLNSDNGKMAARWRKMRIDITLIGRSRSLPYAELRLDGTGPVGRRVLTCRYRTGDSDAELGEGHEYFRDLVHLAARVKAMIERKLVEEDFKDFTMDEVFQLENLTRVTEPTPFGFMN